MKGLEHDKVNDPDKKFSDDYLLKLEKFKIDDFCLEYLYKFIVESRIPNIRLFGNA